MVKAKTRVAPRNKGSKRRKAVAKPVRKIAARQAAPKQARAKVRRAGGTKSKKKRPVTTVERKTSRRVTAAAAAAAEILARANETTIIETNEKPSVGAVVAKENATPRTVAFTGGAPQGGAISAHGIEDQ